MSKILWHSNAPWAPSGYGQQTALFVPRIKAAGHDIAISALYGLQGAIRTWEGIRVYPADDNKAGKMMLAEYARDHADGGDIRDVLVITLYDVWPMIGGRCFTDLRLASWVPVDHEPLPPRVHQFFDTTGARPIAMSQFGERELRAVGLDPLYVPHGVDTRLFRPLPDHRAKARELLQIPEDAFVVGMVANNQGTTPPRKAFPQVLLAFAELHRRHPDTILYLHADLVGTRDGVNLLALAELSGIPAPALRFVDQVKLRFAIPHETMPYVYSLLDVLANPSYGEGFGIPIIEAQACGVPVIVTDWTAMPELCGAGWLVDGDPWYDPGAGAFFKCPGVAEILAALEHAYEARDDEKLREQAREFALGYDADLVVERDWTPVLEALDVREVPALRMSDGKLLKVAG